MSESNDQRQDDYIVAKASIFERLKEENGRALNSDKKKHRDTHGDGMDINENTPVSDVKAPNIFERAKEEFEAVVQTIHHKKEPRPVLQSRDQTARLKWKPEGAVGPAESDLKAPNIVQRAREEIDSIFLSEKSPRVHDKETHGRSNSINVDTAIEQLKGPNVFERAKEEIEAIVDALHPKKESLPEKEQGFGCVLGMGLEKLCYPWASKRD